VTRRIVAYTANVGFGGAEQALATLVAGLDGSADVTVVGTRAGVVEDVARRSGGPRAILLPPAAHGNGARSVGAHARLLARLRPDVLHVNGHHSWAGTSAIAAARMLGIPTVAVEHAVWPGVSAPHKRLRAALDQGLDAHVAVSRRLARDIEELVGLPAGSISTIHNGVAESDAAPHARALRGPTIGYVGRLSPEKGPDTLVRALPAIPGATAVLYGTGPMDAQLRALATELGVSDRMVLAGFAADVRRWLPTFDVLVMPSRREGFGLAAVEAMLARVPVVATDVGGVREVLDDGVTGRLVAPDDPAAIAAAVSALLANPRTCVELADRARAEAVRRFSVASMVHAFGDVYDRVIARARRSGRR